eukprot:g4797.t1
MATLTNGTDKQALDQTSESFFKDFIVKNLDTGESFHIDKVDDYLVKTKAKLSMLTPADSKSGWSIAIPECKRIRGEKNEFIAYRIFITNPNVKSLDMKTYSIYRRYSEFAEMVEKLKKTSWYKPDKMGELPPKSWFGNMSEELIKVRRETLEIFLNTLLYYINPALCPPLDDFFCPNLSVSTSVLSLDDKESMLNPGSIRFMTLKEGAETFGMLLEPSILKKQEEIRSRALQNGNGEQDTSRNNVSLDSDSDGL